MTTAGAGWLAPQQGRVGPGIDESRIACSVIFDESQLDVDGDGPYRKAVIWERYLVML